MSDPWFPDVERPVPVRRFSSRWELRQTQMSNIARVIPCPDFMRASGDVICPGCGAKYYYHPQGVPYEWLNVICDGTYVKL